MAAPSFDRSLSRRWAPEQEEKRIEAVRASVLSFRIGAHLGTGDDRDKPGDDRAEPGDSLEMSNVRAESASDRTDQEETGASSNGSLSNGASSAGASSAGASSAGASSAGASSDVSRNVSSKSSDEISSASASGSKKTQLSHSVSFSLKTRFHKKPLDEKGRDNNKFVEQFVKSSRLSNQVKSPIDNLSLPPPPRSLSANGDAGAGKNGGLHVGGGEDRGSKVARSPSVTVANFIHCKLCLCDYPPREMVQLSNCRCLFCADCVSTYITTTINDGDVLKITCPDGECPANFREIDPNQIRQILDDDVTYANYIRFRTLREIENDPNGTWCPSVGCETICHVCRVEDSGSSAKSKGVPPQPITCPTCSLVFCSVCKSQWHPDGECHNPFLLPSSSSSTTNFGGGGGGKSRSQRAESEITSKSNPRRRSSSSGGGNFFQNFLRRGPAAMEAPGADGALDSSPIKRCPICHILIEREEGCAQMMCKRCKHVFCWYCLESLDNDFLLRHYDRGPCKNKLGHSRASVIWHRTQVVGIFAGFGMLLLMASPFLLLAAPCILCCKCSCCHCLDIDDVEWYEGKGSPGTREARQKRLAKSFGAASTTSGLEDNEEFEDVQSFHSWEGKTEEKALESEMLAIKATTTTTTSATTEETTEKGAANVAVSPPEG